MAGPAVAIPIVRVAVVFLLAGETVKLFVKELKAARLVILCQVALFPTGPDDILRIVELGWSTGHISNRWARVLAVLV